ncbi:MAG TPA: hypothetical protein VEH27_06890 [Methylomirabilota bacterium]|nr:hypothetical protein [Methylomirabilota bacterium]
MRKIRIWHLYLSCFFTPLLLFFVLTGWYQTFTANRNKSLGEQEDLLSKLTSVHVDAVYPSKEVEAYSPQLFQWLVAIMSIALVVTIVLGLVLAFKSLRRSWPVWLALGMGILIPVVALLLGQKR